MKNILKNMLKTSIDIPYDNFDVYPTVIITKEQINKYCNDKDIKCEFIENNEGNNMHVKLDDNLYEVLRFNAGRGGYAIKCRPI